MRRSRRRWPSIPATLLLLWSCTSDATGPDPSAVADVAVSPASATVDVGLSVQLTATVTNAEGAPSTAPVSWSAAPESVATVSSSGLVTGVRAGTVLVTARAGDRSGTATILVHDPRPPAAPRDVVVTPASDTEIDVSWTDSSDNETGFTIERQIVASAASEPGGPSRAEGFVEAGTVGPNVTRFRDSGLTPRASYRYRVSAMNGGERTTSEGTAETTTHAELVVLTAALDDGTLGTPYAATLEATGGSGVFAWSRASGNLPAGLTLQASGAVTGTPTETGTFAFTLTVTSGGQSLSADYSITVTAVRVVSTTLPPAQVGAVYTATLAAAGGNSVYTWSIVTGSLPPGLTLDPSSGVVSGTPTAAGTWTFTVRATSGGQAGTRPLTLTVELPPVAVVTSSLPEGVAGRVYSATLVATGGDGKYRWALTSGTLPAGLVLSSSTGVISGTPTEVGTSTFLVQVTSGGQSATKELTLTVSHPPVLISATGALSAGVVGSGYHELLVAVGGNGTYTWSVTSGALPAGLTLNANTGVISGTPTSAGTSTFTVQATSGAQSAGKQLTLTIIPPSLTITTTSLPSGQLGVPYNAILTASGGSGLTWSIAAGALPGGLSLNAGTGVISGTPTSGGTSTFTVRVSSGAQTGSRALSITISAPPVAVTTPSLPEAVVGAAYNATLAATGGSGSYTWSITAGTLPAGLSLAAGTGVISGTPTAAGTSTFTVRATSAGQAGTRELSIGVNLPSVVVTTTSLAVGVVGIAYQATLAATGGSGSYTWSITTGTLPEGLSLAAGTGVISGTPNAAGTSMFTVQATSGSLSGTKELGLTINTPAVDVTTTALADGEVGTAYDATLAATGGSGVYTWSITAGELPAGVSLAAGTGVISGTPTAVGTATFTVQATSGSASGTKELSLTIDLPPVVVTTSSLPDGAVGLAYSETLAATGGDGAYTWAVSAGTLPTGLSLAPSTGVLSGTPTTSGTANFTVEATSAGLTGNRPLSVDVLAAPYPAPVLSSVAPSTLDAGGGDVVLELSGTGFVAESVAHLDGSPEVTTFVSSSELEVTLPAALRANAQTLAVTVVNPAPGGGTSAARDVTIRVVVELTPAGVVVLTGQSLQLSASVIGTGNQAVSWTIDGAGVGDATVGTISASGLYTAPGAVPPGHGVTIRATSVVDNERSAAATQTIAVAAEDWPQFRRDFSKTGRSGEAGISTANVHLLQKQTLFGTGGRISASPAVATVSGVRTVYVGNWLGQFFAINAETGAQRWQFAIDAVSGCDAIETKRIASSAAVENGVVFFGAANGYVYALNAATGALVWKALLGDPCAGYEIWSSPAVYDGVVYVGVASHDSEPCVVGRVDALDASNGSEIWSFETIDQSTSSDGSTVGGGVWSSPAIDTEFGRLYVGTGNSGRGCNPTDSNAQLYPDGILSLDLATGLGVSFYQTYPDDPNDEGDVGAAPVLHQTRVINECTGTDQTSHWVSVPTKDGYSYTGRRGAGGLMGDPVGMDLASGRALTSPALRSFASSSGCGTDSKQVVEMGNDLFVPTTGGELFDIRQEAGGEAATQWRWCMPACPSPLLSPPAVISDLVFFGGGDGNFYAANLQGDIVYSTGTAGLVASGAAISNSRVYFGSYDGNVYVLRLGGGSPISAFTSR